MAAPDLSAICSLDEFLAHDYDFIVVGGGTAGLVMAARLTENPDITVGVLEAGAANIGDHMIMMPSMYSQAMGDAKYDWLLKTVPQVRPQPITFRPPVLRYYRLQQGIKLRQCRVAKA